MSGSFRDHRGHRRARRGAVATRVGALGAVLVLLALSASAQKVAPRLTGALVVAHLDKVEQAVKVRAAASHDAAVGAIAGQLQSMQTQLAAALGDHADAPLATVSRSARAAATRADAAAQRVQAWLAASADGCTQADASAMATAVAATLTKLAADSSDQKAPLPIVNGVETLDRRPLFVLPQGVAVPKFVLTGANLVDTQCANPKVVAFGPDGKPASAQPQLVGAQAGRVELQWAGAAGLAPGSYTLRLTAQRKAFLVGCESEPPTVAVLQVVPPLRLTIGYTLSATCSGATTPTVLGKGVLPTMDAGQHVVAKTIDVSACKDPTTYTVAATVRAAGGAASTYGPVTQSAAASIMAGIGNGLTLSWDPSIHQLLVRAGGNTCKGVY